MGRQNRPIVLPLLKLWLALAVAAAVAVAALWAAHLLFK
jgi:hypothetical protein